MATNGIAFERGRAEEEEERGGFGCICTESARDELKMGGCKREMEAAQMVVKSQLPGPDKENQALVCEIDDGTWITFECRAIPVRISFP